ncbi:MAG: glycosyltransferase family 4 protein [Candidatus Binatia bacterium]
MARVLLTLDEPLVGPGGRMAGLQVRVLEMAGALVRAGHEVVVAARPAVTADVPFRVVPLDELAASGPVDVWITHPRMVAGWAPSVRARALVVDGYESPFGSFLAHAAALLPRIGTRAVYEYRATLARFLAAIARADRVLCANESQRVSYLTILSMLGRVGPRSPEADAVLCVSSGASAAPPERPRDGTAHDPVLLWCGGCYPWFDVETYLAALPAIVAAVPEVQLRFAGIDGVGGDELPLARRMRDGVAASPELRIRAEFTAWRPYVERGALYAGADVGVCTYGDHLETRLSMRTRVIDMIWGGLPVVVSAGDEMSRVVEAHGLGRVVHPGDSAALAAAVTGLLGDADGRRRATARARVLATGELGWDRQMVPLAAFCVEVAAGRLASRSGVSRGEAIVHLNDGVGRRIADAVRRLGWRALGGWRRARREGVGPVLRPMLRKVGA